MNKKYANTSRIGTIWKYKDADHIKIYINVIGQKMIDALGSWQIDTCTSTVLILK
jgi:hypothetical protein